MKTSITTYEPLTTTEAIYLTINRLECDISWVDIKGINTPYIKIHRPYNAQIARIKAKLLIKVINMIADELGHPKDDLVYLVKQMIRKGLI